MLLELTLFIVMTLAAMFLSSALNPDDFFEGENIQCLMVLCAEVGAVIFSWSVVWQPLLDLLNRAIPENGTAIHDLTVSILMDWSILAYMAAATFLPILYMEKKEEKLNV